MQDNKEETRFVYDGKFKGNLQAAGRKVKTDKPTRTAVIAAAVALAILVTGMAIMIHNISQGPLRPSLAPPETVLAEADSTAAPVTDTIPSAGTPQTPKN